ncbi:hypothetical protein BEH94_04025 [Candidatus Altiarchaeales archaeon WOR_SM1_SCG]|nr:hypothetical protein BEH94_04025 [Candidatus Altiarchaeales archaeon WOR_SM1_SCG]
MKIILSRKGFDSAYGGYPSPILPNNKMISLPIPCERDFTKYSDLKIDDETYYYLMKQLKSKIRYQKKLRELTKNTKCHLDPDICKEVIERCENWKPCFGQINGAQTHLRNEGVKEDDLFLFFGWFKRTKFENGSLKFDEHEPDLHIIFGYLQIGEKKQVNNGTKIPDWMQNHPHAREEYRKISNRKSNNNKIYVARDNLTWDESKSGAGVFKFNEKLILTKTGFSRSRWELPEFFKKAIISYHSEESWKKEYFQSAPIGQEFIIKDNGEVENWAKEIINNNG